MSNKSAIILEPGSRVGDLTLIKMVKDRSPNRHCIWKCRCDCGKTKLIFATNLRRGLTRSCGCLQKEMSLQSNLQHGMSGTSVHNRWRSMIQRCENVNNRAYANYGGRGISICERWKTFENFYTDMGDPPTLKHTIDRIDNDGNYEPGNCRWATSKQQSSNRRSNRLISFRGKTMSMKQWAVHIGMPYATLYRRFSSGWPIERAFSEPVKHTTKRSEK